MLRSYIEDIVREVMEPIAMRMTESFLADQRHVEDRLRRQADGLHNQRQLISDLTERIAKLETDLKRLDERRVEPQQVSGPAIDEINVGDLKIGELAAALKPAPQLTYCQALVLRHLYEVDKLETTPTAPDIGEDLNQPVKNQREWAASFLLALERMGYTEKVGRTGRVSLWSITASGELVARKLPAIIYSEGVAKLPGYAL